MSRSDLDRRPGEATRDYFLRLMRDPMVAGVPVAEVAELAGVAPKKAWEFVGVERALRAAEMVADDVGWTERDGDLGDLLVAALTDYALRACAAGRCTHELCARQRREKALTEARGRFSRPPHDTRHQQAHSACERRFLPARGPGDQSRGALPGRTGGGA